MTMVLFPEKMELEYVVRMLIACFLGILVGLERAKKHKAAGIRTYVIVAICATIFTIVSKYGFLDIATEKTRVDVSRVAHTIVTGVSFLGAGAIFSKDDTIQGVTTAAGIWVMAAIGIACGTGMYFVAMITTALVLITQVLLGRWLPLTYKVNGRIIVNIDDEADSLEEFERFLADKGIEIFGTYIQQHKENRMTYTFKVRVPEKVDIIKISTIIAGRPEVKTIDFYK